MTAGGSRKSKAAGQARNAKKTVEMRALEAAAQARRDGQQMPETVELSNGIVFRVKPVPPLAIRQATMRVAKPQVPKVLIKEKDREEENPSDPTYLEEMEAYEEATSLAALDAVLLLGTKVESLPEGIFPDKEDEWVEDLRFLGIEFDTENPRARYLAWLRFYAIGSDEDLVRLLAGPMAMAGVKEGDVAEAVASFRSGTARGTDQPGASAADD